MRVLITGGSGFIGTNLTAEMRGRGHTVFTCDLKHTSDEESIRADVGEFRQLEEVVRVAAPDIVYHLAAEYGRWNGEAFYESLWRTNVVGTKHVLRLQAEHGFRLVFFSSAEVYGDYGGLMSESVMDTVAIRQMNDYAISKWAGEMQCLNEAEATGSETVRVRPVGCYGPHEYFSPYRGVIPIFVHRLLAGQTIRVHSGHKRIFDYVTDTCSTFANIADNFVPGEAYNIGGREEWAISIEELARLCVEATRTSADLIEIVESEERTTVTKVVDFEKARRDLAHDPQIDIEQGLARYSSWVRSVSA
ncbi:MAG: NAD-dependent epimerase/dehydratase family protein [Acidimicrobiales bacterium]